MAELDGRGIAAVLAADAEVDVRVGLAAHLGGHGDELADAGLIETYPGQYLEGAADACEKLLKK